MLSPASPRPQSILESLGLHQGDTVLIEAPTLAGDFETFLDSFRRAIGPAGTVAVPTCTDREGRPKPVFDPVLSPSESGPFSEFFRARPGAVRSHSTTHSLAALGPGAERLTVGHRSAYGRQTPWGEGPFGHGSPWDVLADGNAWWVILDDGWAESPFLAYLQALYAGQHDGITKVTPYPRFDPAAVAGALERAGLLGHAVWRSHTLTAFRLGDALRAALDALRQDPASFGPDAAFRDWLARVDDIRRHGYLMAGVARAAITPDIPCRRWDGKTLTGVHRDLYARALVLSRGADRAVLVVCDLLGIAHRYVQDIRARVHARAGIPPSAVMVACTHSHSTPDTIGSGNEDPAYLERVVETIAGAICRAAATVEPARLGWGRVPIRGFAHSRRMKMPDGRVYTTRYGVPSTWRVDPALIASQGNIDSDLTVVRVESLSGDILAVVSDFGCHASVALLSRELSGDYPGEAMHALEGALGGRALALCANGSAGDVDPTLEMPVWGPRDDANARRLGRLFAGQVLERLERVTVSDEARIAAAIEPVCLPVRDDWKRLVQADAALLRQEFASVDPATAALARILREGAIQSEVQVLGLNGLALVGLPGEVMTSTGAKLRRAWPNAAVVELTNDSVGYILTPEAESEGGYETGLHLWTRTAAAGEAVLLDAADRLLRGLE